MISKQIIEKVKNRLVKTYQPKAIYLFGSYAWGQPNKESDLDLLIIVKESNEKSYKRSIAGDYALHGLMISKDLIILTKEEFEKRANDITTLCYKIKKEGKILYAQS